jgi:trimeric autotransporter adhesin
MRKKLRAAVVLAGLVLTWSLAQAQVLAVYPNPVQFGTVPLNSPSYSIAVFLSNINAGAIDVTGITISGTNSHDFTFAQACIGTISVNNSCEMLVTFTPSAMGARSANLLITVTGVTSAISVPLAGTGGNPIPAVTSLSPASIYLGSAAVTVTINGAGFLPSSVAYFQNLPLTLTTTYVSATQIKAQVPSADLAQTGTYQLYVSNPAPGGGASLGTNLQVVTLEPTAGSVSPASVVAGTNPGPIVVSGNNFMTGATVQWNGVTVPTTYLSSSQLEFQPTVAELGTAGIVELTITNPSPGTISNTLIFDVTSAVTIKVLDLPANDLVWDPFAQVIYASVPSSYGVNGNSIAVINPATGAVTGFHFAGSEPAKIALSATSIYLYVGLNGNGSVQRLDLPAFTKDIDINLGVTNGSLNFAGDVKVSPTNAHTIAVALSNGCCGLAGPLEFFTDLTKLANSVTTVPINELIFASGTTLYGYQNDTLSQIAVSATGGTLTTQWSGVLGGPVIQYAAGLIYGSDGQVFNPATGLPLGTYDVSSGCCNSNTVQILPNSAINRVFAVGDTPFFNSFGITSYNLSQFTPVAVANLSEVVPAFSNSGPISNLIQWGTNGLAFILPPGCCGSTSAQVVLVQSPTLLLTATKTASPPPVLKSSSPTSATHGSGNFILTLHGSNFVPGSTVTWNGKGVFASYQSPTQLRVYVPKALIAAAGPASILVKNPQPGGGTSAALAFLVK